MKQFFENYETVTAVDALFKPFKPSKSTYKNGPKNPEPIIFENNSQNEKKQQNWRLKLTIPKPFNMTLRATDEKPKQCKRIQSELERTKQMEESECRKMFRANPVPPATFYPIYADMIRKDEIRRKLRKQHCRQMTLAIQKPFDFYYREEVNKLFHAKSMPDLTLNKSKSTYSNRTKTPKSKSVADFSLRNIRAATRAFGDWNWFVKWSLNQNKAVMPKRKLDPPNFAKIHSRMEKKAQNKLPTKVTTVCEPFALHTTSRKKDRRKDEDRLKEKRWPFTVPRIPSGGNKSMYSHQISPPKLNLAAKLRVENSKQMAMKNEEENKKKVWKSALRRCVSAKIAADQDYETDQERLKKKRAVTKSRFIDYQQKLNEIIERVSSRPLLMEQQTNMAAHRRAERIFLEKLQSNGLSEDLIINKSAFPS
uniref:Uncharacterized protein n=1 Tax=Strigamia maritima TaxID=126957 RepID=T1IU39_STRMM